MDGTCAATPRAGQFELFRAISRGDFRDSARVAETSTEHFGDTLFFKKLRKVSIIV